MSRKENREELLRLGNFKFEGIMDVFGHMSIMEIHSVSGNWRTKIDDGTFMFGLVKSIFGMNPDKEDTKQWMNYLHSLVNVEYRFATSGCPVDVLVQLGKMLIEYEEKIARESKKPTKKEEKETLSEMKREQEMKDELKNIEKDEQ